MHVVSCFAFMTFAPGIMRVWFVYKLAITAYLLSLLLLPYNRYNLSCDDCQCLKDKEQGSSGTGTHRNAVPVLFTT